MHKNEINVTKESTYNKMLEEALHLSSQHVDALEVQRKRQEEEK